MSSLINPEYKVKNDTQYIPFSNGLTGFGKDEKTVIAAAKNVDDSNGVSLYENNRLILKAVVSDNVHCEFDKDSNTATFDVIADKIRPGTGITVDRLEGEEKDPIINVDEEYLDSFVKDRIPVLRGENGVLIEDDEELENTKVIKLDDEYIIRQGEYKVQ